MRANLINQQAQSIYQDAVSELNRASAKKAEIGNSLRGYQTQLEHMFDTFAQTQIVQNISAHTEDAQEFVANANEQSAYLKSKFLELSNDIAKLHEQKHRTLKVIEQERIKAQAALFSHPDYVSLKDKILEAENKTRNVVDESDSLLAEVTIKLETYSNHPVFDYLRSVKYGTTEYKPGLLSKIVDRFIAKKYAFSEMEKSYLTLHRLKQSASNSVCFAHEELDLRTRALKTLERSVSDTQEFRTATEALGRIETELSLKVSEEHRLESSLAQHETYSSSGHGQAKAIIVRNLLVMSVETLEQLSGSTQCKQDDEALKHICLLRANILESKKELTVAESEYTQASLNLQRAQSLREILSNSKYSSKDYRYESQSSVEGLLLGYLVGSITANTFIHELDNQCNFTPESSPSLDFTTTDSINDSSYQTTDSF